MAIMVSSYDRIMNTPIQIGAIFPIALEPHQTNDKMKVKDVCALGKPQCNALMRLEEFRLLFELVGAEKQRTTITASSSPSAEATTSEPNFINNNNAQYRYPEPWIFVNNVEEDGIWNAEWWCLSLDRFIDNYKDKITRGQQLAIACEYLDEEPKEWVVRHKHSFKTIEHFYQAFLSLYGKGPEPYYQSGSVWPHHSLQTEEEEKKERLPLYY